MKVFWNNICLVTKMEEQFIANQLGKQTNVEVDYFGLGRKESMLNHFMKNTQLNCDLIVSTDTDVFHDSQYDQKLSAFEEPDIFITIPLIMVYNPDALDNLAPPKAFSDLFKDAYKDKYAFGGPKNSAGKSLIKSLWYCYGKEKARLFAKNARILSMPAAAFHLVQMGNVPIAIVPTIFSLRQGVNKLQALWPKDGAIPIHSYSAFRKETSPESKAMIKKKILGTDFKKLLVNRAAIDPHDKTIPCLSIQETQEYYFLEPDISFLKNLDHKDLYALIDECI